MRPRAIVALLVAGSSLLAVGAAHAQMTGETPPSFPDPARFSRGLFAEGDVGAQLYLGHLGDLVAPGPSLTVRLGYDVRRWIAVEARVSAATSSAELLRGPTQALQLFLYDVEARAQLQLRRVGLYLLGGGGLAQLSTDLLARAGIASQLGPLLVAGAGVDLHSLSRHYSVGVAIDYAYLVGLDGSHALGVGTYLRYTR